MENLIALGQKYVMNTYNRQSMVFVSQGSYVWDSEGTNI